MEQTTASDFSKIACRLLLGQNGFGTSSAPSSTSPSATVPTAADMNVLEDIENTPRFSGQNVPRLLRVPQDSLGDAVRSLSLEMFKATLSEPYELVRPTQPSAKAMPSLDPKSRVIIERVKTFFEELKRRLGRECRGTIFDLPGKLTALACGVSEATVYRVAKTQAGMVHRPIPRTKHVDCNPRKRRRDALQKYGDQWGSVVRHFIHDKLRAERNVTVEDAWKELGEIHEGFRMSQTEFFYLLKGLHFSYRQNDRQAFIFECPSIVRKRTAYLDAIQRARSENHCLVFMDETWVFDCMSSKRGWNDTFIPRFAPAAIMEEFSCGGRTMAKNKGRRAIVISALTDECVVPGSTKVIVSGRRSVDDDYHRDMNAEIFEEWLRETVPQMVSVANGRCVSLVMDNASYHSRQLQKIPTKSSTKAVIEDYLRSNGITVAHNSKKEDLVRELDDFISSRGGLCALRRYATESICAEHGVAVIRLPPYHCFFNPIELCWSQLKGHLCKLGRPGDTLETVRTRALEWMAGVPLEFCAGWASHTMKEETAARNKLVADLHEECGDEDLSSDDDIEDEDPRDERGADLEAGGRDDLVPEEC